MEISSIKIKLIEKIIALDDQKLLGQLLDRVEKEERDFYLDLPNAVKKEIEIALDQVERGETVPWETVLKNLE